MVRRRGRNKMIHDLKILPEFYEAVLSNEKTFEIRRNDREYLVGDCLILNEYCEGKYTGRQVKGRITYITNYEQKEDYVVFSFKLEK